MIYNWINNLTRTISKIFLYVWYYCSKKWFRYIINITFINNCFNFWVRMKNGKYCFIIILCFLYSKTDFVTNLNTLLTLIRMVGIKKVPLTSFSPVTSTNVGYSPQNFLTFSFNSCHTGVKCQNHTNCQPQIIELEPRAPLKKVFFFR